MKKQIFDRIWKKHALPHITLSQVKCPQLFLNSDAAVKVHDKYEEIKTHVKSRMKDREGRLDRHKVAACLVKAILEVSPLQLGDKLSRHTYFSVLCNEILAYHVGKGVMLDFIKQQALKSGNFDSFLPFHHFQGFREPDCNHATYEIHVLKALFLHRQDNDLSIFSFATILFHLEHSTILHYQLDTLQNPMKN